MSALNKSHFTVMIILLALASLLLFELFQAGHERREAPDVHLVASPPQKTAESVMETNTSSPETASSSFANPTPVRTRSITAAPSPTISLADIKACMVRPTQQSSICLDALFREFLTTHTTVDALKIVATAGDTDSQLRYACHPVVHAIGRETFVKKRTVHDSFAACDQTCHSGCYHGAMERFIRGDQNNGGGITRHINDEELGAKTIIACPADQPSRFRFQCLHGLGHALLFSLDYKLEHTLRTCDKLATTWDQSSCWGGAFMENLFPSDPTKSDVSTTDYHYPCNKIDNQYRTDCYVMQTTRMTTMGLDTSRLFIECRKADAYTLSCIQSIGRDLSNDARIKNPRLTAEKCEFGKTEEERYACVRGVVYALIDNTWDGTYAFPFCQTLAEESDRTYCAATSTRHLAATYDRTKETILNDCVLQTNDQTACIDAVREL